MNFSMIARAVLVVSLCAVTLQAFAQEDPKPARQLGSNGAANGTFVAVTPCRVVNTLPTSQFQPFSGGVLSGGGPARVYTLAGKCGLPANATAYQLNIQAMPTTAGAAQAYIVAYTPQTTPPNTSLFLIYDTTKWYGAAAVVRPSSDGSIAVAMSAGVGSPAEAHLIIDVNGYYTGPIVSGPTNVFPDSGNVGIGTTTPNAGTLTVNGSTALLTPVGKLLANASTDAVYLNIRGNAGKRSLLTFTEDTVADRWSLGVKPADDSLYLSTGGVTSSDRFIFTSSGSMGIGTTQPLGKLTVVGYSLFGGRELGTPGEQQVHIASGSDTGEAKIRFGYWKTEGYNAGTWDLKRKGVTAVGDTFSIGYVGNTGAEEVDRTTYFAPSGKVGLGVVSTGSKLQVVGDIRVGSNTAYGDVRLFSDVAQKIPATTGTQYDQVFAVTPISVPGSGVTAKTAFHLRSATAAGQGTNQMDLYVDGDINAGKTIYAKYQDVAELVPSSEQLAPATVVVLDPTNIKHVIASTSAYDTAVAGVISAQPGITLGEPGADKVKVATTGRVKVHVDASKGAIHVGDLLVTSDKAGVAMKSEPMEFNGRKFHQPGTIIGKAIEPLESGEGDILVLLSLQ